MLPGLWPAGGAAVASGALPKHTRVACRQRCMLALRARSALDLADPVRGRPQFPGNPCPLVSRGCPDSQDGGWGTITLASSFFLSRAVASVRQSPPLANADLGGGRRGADMGRDPRCAPLAPLLRLIPTILWKTLTYLVDLDLLALEWHM